MIIEAEISEKSIGVNPFSHSLSIPCTKTYSKDEYVKDDGVMVNKMFYIERQKKSMLFHGKENTDATMNLSHRALQLYLWIVLHLEHNKDYVKINKTLFMSKTGIKSENTYRCAVDELIRQGFIVSTVLKHTYWINPSIFFSGNRLKKFFSKKEVKATWD